MTPKQYSDAIDHIGPSRSQAARMLGIHPRTSRKYAAGDLAVPVTVEKLIEFLLKEERK